MRLFIALKRSQDMKYAGGNGKVSVSQPHFMPAYKSSIAEIINRNRGNRG